MVIVCCYTENLLLQYVHKDRNTDTLFYPSEIIWRDVRQRSARCYSNFPWTGVHTFYFMLLQLILRFVATYYMCWWYYYSVCRHPLHLTKRVFIARSYFEIMWIDGKWHNSCQISWRVNINGNFLWKFVVFTCEKSTIVYNIIPTNPLIVNKNIFLSHGIYSPTRLVLIKELY